MTAADQADFADIADFPGGCPPGIYFNIPDADYHRIFALSYSGMKHLRASTLNFWAQSSLNPDRPPESEDESFAKTVGKAYHVRYLMGAETFRASYVAKLDRKDHPDALVTVDDMKAALVAIDPTLAKGLKRKDDYVAAILTADPIARIWDVIQEDYATAHKGKIQLPAEIIKAIEIGAAMIEGDPDLSLLLTGGVPEVTVVWTDYEHGIPMKCRFDYLKPAAVTDLKSFENRNLIPFDQALPLEIARYGYDIQEATYKEGLKAAVRLARAGKVFGECPPGFIEAFLAEEDHRFLFLFQQKGAAPVAGALEMPSLTSGMAATNVDIYKRAFALAWKKYGVLPWIDNRGIRQAEASEFPVWMTR